MRRVVTVSLAAFVVLGMPDGALGVAWPSIRHDLGLPLSALGLLLLASLAGFLLVSSPSGRLVRRFGTRQLLLAATGVGALGLAIVGVSPGLASLVLASFLIGLAAGGIDPGINAYMALRHGAGLMNLLHAAYGVGAVLGPLLVTALIARQLSWRWAYAVLAAAYLGMVLVTCITSSWRPLADPGEVPGRTPLRRRLPARGRGSRWGGHPGSRGRPLSELDHRAAGAASLRPGPGRGRPRPAARSLLLGHEGVAVVRRRDVRLLDRPGADPADQVQEGARFVVRPGGTPATERLQADHGARRLVVHVEVAG